VERDVVGGVNQGDLAREESAPNREVLLEVLDLEQRLRHGGPQYRQKPNRWPGRTSLSGGVFSKCIGFASAQRGAQRQARFIFPRRRRTAASICFTPLFL